jgi:hypothetical protein
MVSVAARNANTNRAGGGNDHVAVAADDLACEIGIGLRAALAGIAVDCQVLTLDVAQPLQLPEKCLEEAATEGFTARLADASGGAAGSHDRDPVLLDRLLSPQRWLRGASLDHLVGEGE